MDLAEWVERAGDLLELVGVAAIVIGAVVATASLARALRPPLKKSSGSGPPRSATRRSCWNGRCVPGLVWLVLLVVELVHASADVGGRSPAAGTPRRSTCFSS